MNTEKYDIIAEHTLSGDYYGDQSYDSRHQLGLISFRYRPKFILLFCPMKKVVILVFPNIFQHRIIRCWLQVWLVRAINLIHNITISDRLNIIWLCHINKNFANEDNKGSLPIFFFLGLFPK